MRKGTVELPVAQVILIILALLALAVFVYYFFILGHKVGDFDYSSASGVSEFLHIA
ncbi:Uncharacterised protein [uncultured archaeon]|nr:Uncharacterised protein [uncultured archaeon]